MLNTFTMKTRSMNKLLPVEINFDEASEEWRKNKISKGNGTYRYICGQICKSGKPCLRNPISTRNPILHECLCSLHLIK